MTRIDVLAQGGDLGAIPHTCYSAPVATLRTEFESALRSLIPWFAVRTVAGADGLAVGHVRRWCPESVGLRVRSRAVVTDAAIDEAVAELRAAEVGLIRVDARALPWVATESRWLRWANVRAEGDAFVLEDRLTIDDGPHQQTATIASVDESAMRELLGGASRPRTSAELRREAVFLDDDAVTSNGALLWLVPSGGPVPDSPTRWREGDEAISLAAAAIGTAEGDEIGYWQEECWQAARYRRLAAHWSSHTVDHDAHLEAAERFAQAAALLLHASLMSSEARRAQKLDRAADAISALRGADEMSPA